MTVYVQKTIYDLDEIYINAGHKGILVAMKSADLDKALPGLTMPVDVMQR
jgi:prolyl-tRNA editing enzyme YbaK/EbsC (Cys-tRNA(Pro) deacylase)